MKRIYLILIFLLPAYITFSQADAGPDKTVSAGHPKTKIGTETDKDWCYYWEVESRADPTLPEDPPLTDIGHRTIEVSPSQTTTYKLTVTGTDFTFKSESKVTVYKFGIKYFRHSVGKEWKVVVGKPIEFSAIASAGCTDWKWEMKDGAPPVWNPVGGNKQSGTMKIPVTDMPTKNDNFGDKYSTINVSCKDLDGNSHNFSSKDLSPPVKVKIFFEKDATNHPGGVTPNWFYYWSQFIPKGRIAGLIYDNTIGAGRYAETSPAARVTKVSSLPSKHNDETTHDGLHAFYETLAHESTHIILWEGRWGPGGTRVPANDTDHDFYPDSWERSDPEAIFFGFIVGVNDSYQITNSAGEKYEETKCRAVEHALSEKAFDLFDWSYDPTGTYQGKQW